MMECTEIRGRLALYLDNELQEDERLAIEEHLHACETCAGVFRDEQSFIDTVRSSGPLHVASPELRAKVAGIVSAKEPRKERSVGRWIAIGIAAALLIAAMPYVVWNVLQRSTPDANRPPSSFALMAADTHLRR